MHSLRLLGNDAAHINAKNFDDIGAPELEVALRFTKETLKAAYQYEALLADIEEAEAGQGGGRLEIVRLVREIATHEPDEERQHHSTSVITASNTSPVIPLLSEGCQQSFPHPCYRVHEIRIVYGAKGRAQPVAWRSAVGSSPSSHSQSSSGAADTMHTLNHGSRNRKADLLTVRRHWPVYRPSSPFAFSYFAEMQLLHASRHFTPTGARDWEVADELRRAVEYRLTQGHPKRGVFMNLPGPAAWKMIADCRTYYLPFAAEVTYTVRPESMRHGFRSDLYVPRFDVHFVNVRPGYGRVWTLVRLPRAA